MMTEWQSDDVTGGGWRSNEVMECLEMAEMAETLVEDLEGTEWDLDGI